MHPRDAPRVLAGARGRARALLIASVVSGCVSAPQIVLVDRATALEQQAAGSFDPEERALERAAIAPKPSPLTPKQLEALGREPLPEGSDLEPTDADRVDELLVQHCIGEGRDGLLVDTSDACRGPDDKVAAALLIDRTNRARRQLWKWEQGRRDGGSVEDARRAWREAHASGVVCGAWIQDDDGRWHDKGC